jgi:predicted  nucleic acid-binding Zn-ribbon protein
MITVERKKIVEESNKLEVQFRRLVIEFYQINQDSRRIRDDINVLERKIDRKNKYMKIKNSSMNRHDYDESCTYEL